MRAQFGRQSLAALVRPLTIGSSLGEGFVLAGARVAADPPMLVYRIEPGPVEVLLERRDDDANRYAWTRNFNVSIRAESDPLAPVVEAAVRRFVTLVRGNDDQDLRSLDRWITERPPETDGRPGGPPALYLVPGHLSNPYDLSLRALHLLATTEHVFVEEGKEEEVRQLLARFGSDAAGRRIVGLPANRAAERRIARREAAAIRARGEDLCVFGANEGVPCFQDPGGPIVREAARQGFAIRSVGGPSVLGTALMRMARDDSEFLFVAATRSGRGTASVMRCLARIRRLDRPVVLFLPDGDKRRMLLGAVRPIARLDPVVTLCCDLTREGERVIRWDPRAEPPPELASDAKVVVLIEARGRDGRRGGGGGSRRRRRPGRRPGPSR